MPGPMAPAIPGAPANPNPIGPMFPGGGFLSRPNYNPLGTYGTDAAAFQSQQAMPWVQALAGQGTGGLFCVSFQGHEIWDMRDAFTNVGERYFLFRRLLLDRGIHIFPTEKGLWYISAAHTDEDIEQTLRIVDEVFGIMKSV